MMQQANDQALNATKSQLGRRWTKQELLALTQVVKEVNPQTSSDWSQVCDRMHSRGSRRLHHDYKRKFLNEMTKRQKDVSQQKKEWDNEIIALFQEGNSIGKIVTILQQVTPREVQNVLCRLFSLIYKTSMKVVGKNKARELSMKDHRLFSFIKEHQLRIKKLGKVRDYCLYLKELRRPSSKFKKENPQKYLKLTGQFDEQIDLFNKDLMKYTNIYQEKHKDKSLAKKKSTKEEDEPKVFHETRIAIKLLKVVSENPHDFRQYASLLPDGNMDNEQLDKSVSVMLLKTATQLKEDSRFMDENTQNSLLRNSDRENIDESLSQDICYDDNYAQNGPFQTFQRNESY